MYEKACPESVIALTNEVCKKYARILSTIQLLVDINYVHY